MRNSYRVDLKAMAALCEANYLRLKRLSSAVFDIPLAATNPFVGQSLGRRASIEIPDCAVALSLELCDVAPYTTTLLLELSSLPPTPETSGLDFEAVVAADAAEEAGQAEPVAQMSAWLSACKPMRLQMYHDLTMTEVTDYAGQGVGRSRNDYPNPSMLAQDERWQQNVLLGEWLARALQTGVSKRALALTSAALDPVQNMAEQRVGERA